MNVKPHSNQLMLDENTLVSKTRLALFDYTVFKRDVPQSIWELENFRTLQYEKSPSWLLRFVYLHTHKSIASEVLEACRTFGISFFDVTELIAEESIGVARELVNTSDIIYAPVALRPFPIYTRLLSPATAKAAVGAVCWFSTSMEPFTPDNYYALLKSYGA